MLHLDIAANDENLVFGKNPNKLVLSLTQQQAMRLKESLEEWLDGQSDGQDSVCVSHIQRGSKPGQR